MSEWKILMVTDQGTVKVEAEGVSISKLGCESW